MKRLSLALALCFALIIGFAVSASAQQSGTINGVFAYDLSGPFVEVAEGTMHWSGMLKGVFFNNEPGGFLDKTAEICPSTGIITPSGSYFMGNCIMTDSDGDQVMLIWDCPINAKGICTGPFTFIHGTGKYTGITGGGTHNGTPIGATSQGYSPWTNVTYKIPKK